MEISATGAMIGLIVAIVLIIYKVNPSYCLMFGALLGGLLGGNGSLTDRLPETVKLMIDGAKDITPATLRIIAAGVLAGVLIESGAAARIALTITKICGDRFSLLAVALATMLLTTVGVFIDISVITVSPIALAVAKKIGFSRGSVLLAMIGGGKSGNLISPNPNTIATATEFKVDLSELMFANLIPAVVGLAFTVILTSLLTKRGESVTDADDVDLRNLPSIGTAILGPLVAIFLLTLRPFCGVVVDPLVALPVGGIAGCLAMGKFARIRDYMNVGLSKMVGVAVLLMGTGTLAGIIKASAFKTVLINVMEHCGLPGFMLAPVSGIVMSAATASTTAGATVASQTFSAALLAMGLTSLAAATMIHAGATVLDHLPHGTFFHATGGAVGMKIGDRLKLIPYETLIGGVLVLVSTLLHGAALSTD